MSQQAEQATTERAEADAFAGGRFKFSETGDFRALNAAQAWCRDHGISYGSLQRDEPVGLMVGDYDIAKWRNLSASDRAALDGTLTGDKRNGPVFIQIKTEALARARASKAEAR